METVMQEYNKEVPVVPLYFRADVAVTPKNLKNYFVTGHQVAGSNWAEYWTLE
jgi:peptide/nickel transport system substrate-binding protein